MSRPTSNELSFDRHAIDSDLALLLHSEFGSRRELLVRCFGIIIGGIALWAYEGTSLGPVWAAAYLLALTANYHALTARGMAARWQKRLCVGGYCLLTLIYLAMPVYLLVAGDPFLSFCAALAVIAFAIFTLYRPETPDFARTFDVLVGWMLVVIAAYSFMPSGVAALEQGLIAVLCAVVGLYYTMTLISTRKARAELRRATQRNLDEQKMEAIGRLSGGIAHDFNNILTAMLGNLELYNEVEDAKEKDALVSDARKAGNRASELIVQMLAFAQRTRLEVERHDAREIAKNLCVMARRMLPARIQLEHRWPEQPACVLADAGRLHKALLHLVLNAQEAVEGEGSITVAVDLIAGPATEAGSDPAENPEDAHLRFTIADDGPGMNPEVASRAAEPFFTTKPVGKGSGLGLSTAMGFAEQSGGALRIRTGPLGTAVMIHLPLCP
ncbi:sensor histidine kinase [Gymnodinialimonas ceratoperidinii]|uniref:histidine kinase n=1 Tax=Gymnodinialimonas ceratoperidinii TaxID=2856823 RepID=A0A8F6TV76_9RHOB|nr:ATP-binding protein [Gymnodinialimonas ceratoperidinii]QXT38779.1 hypothetical protein KYE46_12650 [Gymnodinialimonas ceratoperidinii]